MIPIFCPKCHARTIGVSKECAIPSAQQADLSGIDPPASEVRCQQCGYKRPIALAEAPSRRGFKIPFWLQSNRWRQRFYQAYQKGDFTKAEAILYRERYSTKGLEQAYKRLKREDRIDALFKYTTWLVLAYCLLKLIAYMGHRTTTTS